MMTAADWASMATDLQAIRDHNPVSIVIRRGNNTLNAQTVRFARMGLAASTRRDAGGIEQSEQRIVILGAVDIDIELGDRFTTDGDLYEVDFIRPNRRAARIAEARIIE